MQQGTSSTTSATGAGSGLHLQPGQSLTDEQILGLEPVTDASAGSIRHSEERSDEESPLVSGPTPQRDSSGNTGPRNDGLGEATSEPAWLKSLDAQPEAAAEARQWRQAALDAAALDKDYFSTEPGARAAFAARLHQTDPAAFRAMLADAARILAERDPQGLAELARQLGGASLAESGGAAPKSLLQSARNPLGSPPQIGEKTRATTICKPAAPML